MRDIEFRVMRDSDGKWLYFSLGDLHAGDSQGIIVAAGTWCQYTGLKDKNGVEIYEGDIVRAPHDFGPGGFSIRKFTIFYDVERGYQWSYWLMDQAEVIGNIYENPEFMEQKQ